ncbi:hypothetical protein [Microbacterium sp. HMWF026]|uniref:hypothetical protein n=1 Tax=Microbacterium sp. HMWF026 TaxID=2056861 RepID=UPI0011B2497D|nr:hypothetical protein [Microbacterium sp. HMWF026]
MSKFELAVEWGDRHPKLGGIIGSWAAYVSHIAADIAKYPAEVIGSFGYDDYIGALSTRNALEGGIKQLLVDEQDGEFFIVKTIDEYFRCLTRDDPGRVVIHSEPLFADYVNDESFWWLRRIPKGGSLGYEIARVARAQAGLRY